MKKKHVKDCKGGEDCHEEYHLCKIAKRHDLERIRELVRDARFLCSKCGRSAHDVQHLCKAVKM